MLFSKGSCGAYLITSLFVVLSSRISSYHNGRNKISKAYGVL